MTFYYYSNAGNNTYLYTGSDSYIGYGYGGNDSMSGGAYHDTVYGGEGNDTVYGVWWLRQ